MSYQEERKFFTYFTNINLRALLMSDGIINDLKGSMERHSQNHASHQSFHISSAHTVLLDLWRISQATRRRYGAEGNTGKYGTFYLDLSRLVFYFSLRWQWQLILQPVLGFCNFFSFLTNRIYKLYSPSLMLSKSSSVPWQNMIPLGFFLAGVGSSTPVHNIWEGAVEQATLLWAAGRRSGMLCSRCRWSC